MANTIRAAKNTFLGGLVMDLAPDTTPNEVLTSALNATLVTFNGNELLLQNDMGNGRVETARLPEGYIPVGTCEFGDIIYIVSYNPLTNRSQIGCFPSPERLISSEEVGSNGQGLSASDFQELVGEGEKAKPTGKLVANSVKKILYNNELNPGDKFIIYDKKNAILNEKYISDIGNTDHIFGAFPKFLKIHVVAIEDSGKINYLDSTVRWYEGTNPSDHKPNNYYIRGAKNGVGGPDIDSYRNKLSSGYSVFQSKISGKLALLIELEKITGFSCTHTIYTLKLDNEEDMSDLENQEPSESDPQEETNTFQDPCIYKYKNTKYISYINFTWETEDNDVNPYAAILTESLWVGRDSATPGIVHFWKFHGTDSNNANYSIDSLSIGEGKGFSTNKFLKVYYRTDELVNPAYSTDEEANYYEALIDNPVSVDQLRGDFTYETFVGVNYNAQLKSFHDGLVSNDSTSNYSNEVLSKLNINKTDSNDYGIVLPDLGKYYINAVERRDNVIYSKSSSTGKLFKIDAISIPDYIVNNYFHYPVYKKFLDFIIPTSELIYLALEEENNKTTLVKIKEVKPDITNMVYKYLVTPAMPYGLLEEFAVTNYIDFSKLGSGEIKLRTWKYFCGENMVTLTFGLDAYEEENMGIQEVAMEFYDNQGVAAVYHIENKASYSGQFTEIIPLNGSTRKSNMNATNGDTTYIHCGTTLDRRIDGCLVWNGTIDAGGPAFATDFDINPLTDNVTGEPIYYMNDCGTLYYGMLYLVKIIVKYCPIDVLGNYDTSNDSNFRIFYRWMWTTTMYNDNYYQVEDFNELPFELTLDANLKYETTSDYYYSTFNYDSPENLMLNYPDEIYKHMSAKVLVITDKNEIDTTYIDNQGNIPGGGGDNPDIPEDPPLWTNWKISYSDDRQLKLTITCTKPMTYINRDKIHVEVGGTQITSGWSIAAVTNTSQAEILFTREFSADLSITITTDVGSTYQDNWAYVHMNSGENILAPNRTLTFQYKPTNS